MVFPLTRADFKAEVDRIGSYFSYKVLAQTIQFSLAAGFSGGYGTAAAVGSTFKTGLIPADVRKSIGQETVSSIFLVFKKAGVGNYIDENVISRISGTATDYLVFFGIASIKIPVIVRYAVPLDMLSFGSVFASTSLRK